MFCVGVPGGCFLLLWRARDEIKMAEEVRSKNKSLDGIRFLFENYKPECWCVRERICSRLVKTTLTFARAGTGSPWRWCAGSS